MGKVCQKCGYERTGEETAPEFECPSCGAIYRKVEAALASKKAAPTPSTPNNHLPDSVVVGVLAVVGLIVWLIADPDIFLSRSASGSGSEQSSIKVSQEEYGSKWPYTIPYGTLRCESAHVAGYKKQYVTLSYAGSTYGINGSAQSSGRFKPLAEIWRDNPQYPGSKVPDPGIIQRGVALCN